METITAIIGVIPIIREVHQWIVNYVKRRKRKWTRKVQDYDQEARTLLERKRNDGFAYQRRSVGTAVVYDIFLRGREIGRWIFDVPPRGYGGEVTMSLYNTARGRGAHKSFSSHGDADHIPEDEQRLDAAFMDLFMALRSGVEWLHNIRVKHIPVPKEEA